MVVWGDKPLCEGVTIIGLSTAKNKALLGLEGDLLPYESYGKPRLLTYKWPSCTRRKLVHLQEIARTYHYECQPKVFGYSFEIIDNRNDSFMYFLTTSHNGQVAMNDGNGQVFF